MIRFEKLAATEKVYPFVNAKVAAAYKNGTIGTVEEGVFTAGADGFQAIMNVEDGDDAKSDGYVIPEGADARIVDFALADGQIVNITADELPETVEAGNKLSATSEGILEVNGGASSAYFEVIEPTSYGCRAKIVK